MRTKKIWYLFGAIQKRDWLQLTTILIYIVSTQFFLFKGVATRLEVWNGFSMLCCQNYATVSDVFEFRTLIHRDFLVWQSGIALSVSNWHHSIMNQFQKVFLGEEYICGIYFAKWRPDDLRSSSDRFERKIHATILLFFRRNRKSYAQRKFHFDPLYRTMHKRIVPTSSHKQLRFIDYPCELSG